MEIIDGSNNGEVIIGTSGDDYIRGFGGDDAIAGGAGNDVLHGGLGSSFLIGGDGHDTFIIDGRGAFYGQITWSTIVDLDQGTNGQESISVLGTEGGCFVSQFM